MSKYKSTLQRDREAAKSQADSAKALTKLENDLYKKTVQQVESAIETIDRELKDIKKKLHSANLYSGDQLRVFRKIRMKLNKERKKYLIKLDLLKK